MACHSGGGGGCLKNTQLLFLVLGQTLKPKPTTKNANLKTHLNAFKRNLNAKPTRKPLKKSNRCYTGVISLNKLYLLYG